MITSTNYMQHIGMKSANMVGFNGTTLMLEAIPLFTNASFISFYFGIGKQIKDKISANGLTIV